jgi:hypothetical protein
VYPLYNSKDWRKLMKKTLMVLMMVSLAAMLFVSCDNKTKEPETKTYKVGEIGPAGGIIFYVNPNAEKDGWTYLEAAPSDLEEKYKWGSDGDYGTSKEVGTGKSNTEKLLAAKAKDSSLSFPAAEACDSYSLGDKTDWFLPSMDELDTLNKVLQETNSTAQFPSETMHWSSSQESSSNTYYLTSSGGRSEISGSMSINVRPVRSFK